MINVGKEYERTAWKEKFVRIALSAFLIFGQKKNKTGETEVSPEYFLQSRQFF